MIGVTKQPFWRPAPIAPPLWIPAFAGMTESGLVFVPVVRQQLFLWLAGRFFGQTVT